MASAISSIRHEWHRFRDDRPGERFRNHNRRMRHHSRALVVARVAAGVVLLAIGVVMLFVPGPGIVVIAFGLGALAGRSRRLAAVLDRAEPMVRGWWEAIVHAWFLLPRWVRAGLAIAATIGVAVAIAAAAYAGWRMFRA